MDQKYEGIKCEETDLKFEETNQQNEIFEVSKKVETDQKYEETELKFEETNQQIEIFQVFLKKWKRIKNMRKRT